MLNKKRNTWAKRNPEKIKIHRKTNYEIKAGRIIRPKYCSFCGEESKYLIHAHHYDYKHYSHILWACPKCHVNTHLPIKKSIGISINDYHFLAKTVTILEVD